MWEKGVLGDQDPKTLLHTLVFLFGKLLITLVWEEGRGICNFSLPLDQNVCKDMEILPKTVGDNSRRIVASHHIQQRIPRCRMCHYLLIDQHTVFAIFKISCSKCSKMGSNWHHMHYNEDGYHNYDLIPVLYVTHYIGKWEWKHERLLKFALKKGIKRHQKRQSTPFLW